MIYVSLTWMNSLLSNIQKHMWNFKPSEMRKYVLKPCLIVWGKGLSQSCSAGKKQQFKLRAIGEGCQGKIQVSYQFTNKK